ncbi:MAG: FAD-binding protein [Firmicutes bacterium]|nr:FAD-binding protein [Bacillota bacterium]
MHVIVIGGGGAGLLAAVSAREAGAGVTLVSKAPVGLANCTAHSGGGFTFGSGDVGVEQHRTVTLKAGKGISDERLVSIMTGEAASRVMGLKRYGVALRLGPRGAFAGEGLGDLIRGQGITRPLIEYARRAGVRILDRTMATDLVLYDGCVGAVELLDLSSGKLDVVPCSAVVVATGGGGRIYSRTDNPVRTTGDGYWLLAKAGATFRDMEFVQFYPLGLDEPGFPVWMVDLGLMDYCRLTNAMGEQFLEKRFREWGISSGHQANLIARDSCTIEVARQVQETGKVLLYLNEIDRSKLTSAWDRSSLEGTLRMYPKGRTPASGPIGVSPIQHYFCGGVVTDETCYTGIPGVYACGEVAGGVDGANRVGGNALTNLAVFGPIAGQAAARFARSADARRGSADPGGPGGSRSVQAIEQWREQGRTGKGTPPAQLKKEISRLCDSHLGPIRTAGGLQVAVGSLDSLRAELPRLAARSAGELAGAFECEALLSTAQMVATSALRRQESRGVHYRSDFPAEDPRFAAPLTRSPAEGRD